MTRGTPFRIGRLLAVAAIAAIAWQAALGVRETCRGAMRVPLALRIDALGSDTDWRYRAVLGEQGDALRLAIRAHVRPDTVVVLVHDGGEDTLRSAALLTGILYPQNTLQREALPGHGAIAADPQRDVLLVLLGPTEALGPSLTGWHAVDGAPRGRVWSTLAPVEPPAAAASVPTVHPASPPRMDGWRVLLMLALPLLSGALWLVGCGLRPRDEPLAFTGWAWMTGCTWIGLVSFGWLIGGGSVWSLGPATWTALSLLPAAVCAVPLARRGARGRAANAMSAASESAGSVSATLVSAASAPVSAAERTTACAATRRDASPRWERVLFAACLAFALVSVADRIVLAGTRVVASGDEGSIWTAKARALWTAGGLDARFAELAHREFGIWHQDYPPLDPLLQVYAAQLAGRPLDFENRLPVLLFLPALLLLLAGALRRCARPALAGLLLVAFATCTMTVDVAQQAYADALVAVGMLALLESVRRWRREGTTAWLALASVAATALVFSKNESRMLLLAAALGGAAAWWAHRRAAGTREQVEGSVRVDLRVERRPHGAAPVRLRAADAVWLLPPLAVLVAITAVNARFGFANDLLASSDGRGPLERLAGQGAGRVAEVLRLCAGALLAACRDSSLLVAGCALLVLLFPRHLLAPRAPGEVRPDRSAWSLTLLLAACGYLLVFLGTPLDVAWHVRWSVPRLCFQLLPVAAVCLAAGLTWLLRRAGSAGAQV